MTQTVRQQVIFREILGNFSPVSHRKWEISLKRINVHILEMEDVLFHHNSAVMMPENPEGQSSAQGGGSTSGEAKVTGVKALALAFKQFEFNPKQKAVLAGHTDTSGDAGYNFKLSELRAKNVLYLLIGEQVEWAKICQKKQKIEDHQQLLNWVFKKRKWLCNPGEINNKWSSTVEQALTNFVTFYNTEYADKKGKTRIDEGVAKKVRSDSEHRWPVELWEAVYNLYNDELASVLQDTPEQLDKRRIDTLRFVSDSSPFVACGESFPIKDGEKSNYRSQANRRVEILFFDADEAPELTCPKQRASVHKEKECPLYHGLHFLPLYIDPSDLNAVMYHLSFKYYDRVGKKLRDVPAGLAIVPIENGVDEIPNEQEVVTKGDSVVYAVKLKFKTPLNDANRKTIHFEFRTNNQWVFTDSDTATPTLVTETPANIAKFELAKRLKYYDLPVHWSSRNYWTRYDGNLNTGGRFEDVLKTAKKLKPFGTNVTAPDKPLVFSLDDLVLTKPDGSQTVMDKDNTNAAKAISDKSRHSLLYVKGDKLLHYNPESADYPYFSKGGFPVSIVSSPPSANRAPVITDTPADGAARVVLFANDVYHIGDKRTAQGAEPFDPATQIRGARAACLAERYNAASASPPVEPLRGALFQDRVNSWAHQRYFAKDCGDYELHYLHDGCIIAGPDGLKRRAFLLVYWNGVFIPDAAAAATQAQVDDFATKGLKNAYTRWMHKAYTIEPLVTDPKSDIQIFPVFFFEAKRDNLGGEPKCTVSISTVDEGWMNVGTRKSRMFWKDFEDRDYLGVGNFADIDGNSYATLVVAHELNHAMGKDDEYHDRSGFAQYYPGMPFSDDAGSMMLDNRAPRVRHIWPYVNWINDAAKDANQLKPFLSDIQYKGVHRFGTRKLSFHLSAAPTDYRDIYVPFKKKDSLSTGTGTVNVALYKLGEDETAWNIAIAGRRPTVKFDGLLAVYLKLGVNFVGGTGAARRDWMSGLRNQIHNLNHRFSLQAPGAHDVKNTYFYFLAVTVTPAPADSHFTITVKMDGSSTITTRSGGTLALGDAVPKPWVVNYILGRDDSATSAFFRRLIGTAAPGRENLQFLETWFQTNVDASFRLQGS